MHTHTYTTCYIYLEMCAYTIKPYWGGMTTQPIRNGPQELGGHEIADRVLFCVYFLCYSWIRVVLAEHASVDRDVCYVCLACIIRVWFLACVVEKIHRTPTAFSIYCTVSLALDISHLSMHAHTHSLSVSLSLSLSLFLSLHTHTRTHVHLIMKRQ